MGRDVLGGQPRHCIRTNASRGLPATAEFLCFDIADRMPYSNVGSLTTKQTLINEFSGSLVVPNM